MTTGTEPMPGGPSGGERESASSRWGRRLLLILMGVILMAAMFQSTFQPPSVTIRRRPPGRVELPVTTTGAPAQPSQVRGARGVLGDAGAPLTSPVAAIARIFPDGLQPEGVGQALRRLPVPADIAPSRRSADLVLRAGSPRMSSPGQLFGFDQAASVPTVVVPATVTAVEIAGGLLPFLSAPTGLGFGGAAVPLRSPSVQPGYAEPGIPGAPAVRRRRTGETREAGLFMPIFLPETGEAESVRFRTDGIWEIRLMPGVAILDAGTCVTFDFQARVSNQQWVSLSDHRETEFRIAGPEPYLVPHHSAANRFCLPITAPREADGRRVTIEATYAPVGRPKLTVRSIVILRVR